MAKAELIVSFTDQSDSFTHGVEYGRILCKLEAGLHVVENNGFPVHTANVELLRITCAMYEYTPMFSAVEGMDEWTNFCAIRAFISGN